MHAKTVWDVLLAGVIISSGVAYVTLERQGGRLKWYRRLGYVAASLGFICWGIGSIALSHYDDVLPFALMAVLGAILGGIRRD